ncbi:MAG TPA: hypothetical protein VIP11_07020 [Gemmatimonadaceae bacterium]
MTTWIGTNQTGWDTQSIGFHSINGCTGLVVSTQHWVAGWHVGGGAGGDYAGTGQGKAAFQGSAFLDYLKAINPNPWPAVGLPGGTVRIWNIHSGHTDWKDEIRDFAAILGYQGEARGLDLKSKVGIDSVDVVVTRNGSNCEIEYKRTSKMTHVQQNALQRTNSVVRTVRGTPDDAVRTQPLLNSESDSASVIATKSNKGLMHRAGWLQFSSINV